MTESTVENHLKKYVVFRLRTIFGHIIFDQPKFKGVEKISCFFIDKFIDGDFFWISDCWWVTKTSGFVGEEL